MSQLHLVDVFWTFQGEGANAGRRALFVRMPFCNLQCPWCDTEFNSFTKWSTEDFENYCRKESARFAVITGGEPSLHKHTPKVIEILKKQGFTIAMESNGTSPPPDGVDYLTVSPKAYADEPFYICDKAMAKASEFKYVAEAGFPFEILNRHKPDGRGLYLSPEFNRMSESLKEIEDYIVLNPQWKVSLQTHKWMGIK